MPFIGVRISWLMLARNSDLARLAASAAARACSSRKSISFSCVMSIIAPLISLGRPGSPSTRDLLRIHRTVPSGSNTRKSASSAPLNTLASPGRLIQRFGVVGMNHLPPFVQVHAQRLSGQAH